MKTIDKRTFSLMVEEIVSRSDSYIDAIHSIIEEMEIEPEDVPMLLTASLKRKIHDEAKKRNLLSERNTTANLLF
ncbi:MAG: hypothetical protein D6732_23575 [Methanobacteriota archaeon]|nr:MAG: hypothetical protein D6732_23575 [Euryarchaeota archaeon]